MSTSSGHLMFYRRGSTRHLLCATSNLGIEEHDKVGRDRAVLASGSYALAVMIDLEYRHLK
jgi:hypothetical protein